MQLIKFISVVIFILLLRLGLIESNIYSNDTNDISVSIIKIEKKELVLDRNKGIMIYNKEPFSGYSMVYQSNSLLVEKIEYRIGKKHGKMQKWYPDGTLSYEAHYIDNKLNGSSKSWWSNKILRSESHFVLGVADGVQKQWYKSGAPFKAINLVSGREEGLQRAWRENGKLYINYEAKNGRIFGLKRSTLCFELEDETIQFK
jgi:antitoxin component YwqK of YwqJK toxin-antitoxin module